MVREDEFRPDGDCEEEEEILEDYTTLPVDDDEEGVVAVPGNPRIVLDCLRRLAWMTTRLCIIEDTVVTLQHIVAVLAAKAWSSPTYFGDLLDALEQLARVYLDLRESVKGCERVVHLGAATYVERLQELLDRMRRYRQYIVLNLGPRDARVAVHALLYHAGLHHCDPYRIALGCREGVTEIRRCIDVADTPLIVVEGIYTLCEAQKALRDYRKSLEKDREHAESIIGEAIDVLEKGAED